MEQNFGPPGPRQQTPQQALLMTRIIWGALLMGQVVFGVVLIVLLGQQGASQVDPELPGLLFKVAVGMLIVAIPAAFFLRSMVFGGEEYVRRDRFASGNILYMAVLEGVSFFGLVTILLAREWWPYAAVPAVAFFVQLLGFPFGDRLEGLE